MGCVFGKGDRRSIPDRRRSSEQSSVADAVKDVVRVRKEQGVSETQKSKRHTGDFPPLERRRPRPEIQQGWPSWLMAVAGDAIRDWTPRRANTFEKLDKVNGNPSFNILVL